MRIRKPRQLGIPFPMLAVHLDRATPLGGQGLDPDKHEGVLILPSFHACFSSHFVKTDCDPLSFIEMFVMTFG